MHQPRSIAEEEIISQCKTGSLKYQEALYKRFYSYAMGISLRYSLNRDDALEVVNDGFIKVFNAIGTYNSDKPFKAWLRTIVVNTAIDRRRKELKFQLHIEIDNAMPISKSAHSGRRQVKGGSGTRPVARAEAGRNELAEALEGLQRGQAQRDLEEVRAPRAQILHMRARLRTTPQSGHIVF